MSKDNFQWTDELRKEWEMSMCFKFSNPDRYGGWLGYEKELAKFKSTHEQTKEKERGWEIWAYEKKEGVVNYSYLYGHKILSVKRLSDGEVFSVGDEVTWSVFGACKITRFEISNGKCMVYFLGSQWYFLDQIKKSKPIEKERITTRVLPFENFANGKFMGYYVVEPTKPIPEEKLPAIKQAIEKVLNDEVFDRRLIEMQKNHLKQLEDAFNAARETTEHFNPNNILGRTYIDKKFPTFEDYIAQSKK